MKKAVILLSGGLDSLVALGFPQSEYRIELALTFDYGQKSVQNEIDASQKICKYYNVEHKVIKLEWLKEITKQLWFLLKRYLLQIWERKKVRLLFGYQ